MASRTSNSIKNIFSGLGLKIILLVFQFATKTLFVQYLSGYLGLNALLTSVISYLNITELGISTAINFAMYKPIAENNQEKVKEYLAYYRKIYHILGIIVIAIGLVLAFFLPLMMNVEDLSVGYKEIYLIYFLYLINSAYPYFVYAYRGGFITASQEEYRLTPILYISTVGSSIMQACVLVVFNGSFLSFALYTAIPILFSIIRSLLNGLFAAKWYPYIKEKPTGLLSKEEIKGLFKNTYGIAIARICVIINNSIDSIIISAFIGINVLGKYSLYRTLIGMVVGFINILFISLLPSVGNLNAESSTEHKKKVFNAINFSAFWIYGVTGICFFCSVQPFMAIWAGQDKVMSVLIPAVVVFNYVTDGMIYAVSLFREGCGLYYIGRYRPIFSTIINIVFSIGLGYWLSNCYGDQIGVFGILLATIISRMAVVWWFDAYIVFKNVFYESPKRYLVQYIIRLALICGIGFGVFFVNSLVLVNQWVSFVISIISSFVISNLVFIALFHKKPESKYLLQIFTMLLSRRKTKKRGIVK